MVHTSRTSRARAILIAAAVSMILPAFAAAALAATPQEAAAGADDGIYVEPGAEAVDTTRLAEAIDRAADDLDLTVVVLAESGDAVGFADDVRRLIGGTVLVFTPDAYGAASSELSQSDLDAALDDAAARLAGDDVADGVAAFVDAAVPNRIRWGVIITVVLLGIIVIALVGRVVERRATSGRRRVALERRWKELERRADALADPVLELSTRVELDGRSELAAKYRAAASQYGEVRDALARPAIASAVDSIDTSLTELEARLAEIERALAAAKQRSSRRRSDDET